MCVFVCVNSGASRPGEHIRDPAEGALGHGDLERPSGRHRHWIRHLAAGAVRTPRVSSLYVCEYFPCRRVGLRDGFFPNWLNPQKA